MTDKLIEIVGRAIEAADTLDRDKLARAALAAINLPARLDEEYSRGWSDATQSATTALQAFDAASYTQGWNEAIEAALAEVITDQTIDKHGAHCCCTTCELNVAEAGIRALTKDSTHD